VTTPPGDVRPGLHVSEREHYAGDVANAEFAAAQGAELQRGAWLRPMPEVAATNYHAYSHAELWRMVTDGNDPAHVGQQGAAWTELGNVLVEFRDALLNAMNATKAEWDGPAATAAMNRAAEIAIWFGKTAQGAQLTGNRLATQSESAQRARDTMPAPGGFSVAAAGQGQLTETDPLRFAQSAQTAEDQFRADQAAHERAAEIVKAHDTVLVESASTLPVFSPPENITGPTATTASSPPASSGAPGSPSGDPAAATTAAASTAGGEVAGGRDVSATARRPATPLGAWPGGGGEPNAAAFGGGPAAGVGAVAARGPGAGAGRGLYGVPPGRARSDEDVEHDRPDYLEEPDPNEIFGNNQRTVKPVIGE
jgi:hypothetical protein